MKIEKNKQLKESASGPYWLITKFYVEEDTTEYEVFQGPRQEASEYMVEQTVDFLIDELGQEIDFSIFSISPAMAARLDNSIAQTIIDKTIKEIFNFKVPIYVTSSLNASDFAVDYIDAYEQDKADDTYGYDVDSVLDKKEFKEYLTGIFKVEIEAAFRRYFEN